MLLLAHSTCARASPRQLSWGCNSVACRHCGPEFLTRPEAAHGREEVEVGVSPHVDHVVAWVLAAPGVGGCGRGAVGEMGGEWSSLVVGRQVRGRHEWGPPPLRGLGLCTPQDTAEQPAGCLLTSSGTPVRRTQTPAAARLRTGRGHSEWAANGTLAGSRLPWAGTGRSGLRRGSGSAAGETTVPRQAAPGKQGACVSSRTPSLLPPGTPNQPQHAQRWLVTCIDAQLLQVVHLGSQAGIGAALALGQPTGLGGCAGRRGGVNTQQA